MRTRPVSPRRRQQPWGESAQGSCPDMPLLNALVREVGPLSSRVEVVVGLQHLLGSTVRLIDQLVVNGVSPDDVFLLGKPYSTSPQALSFLETHRDYWVHPGSVDQSVASDNDSEMDARIVDLLERVEARLTAREGSQHSLALLIDDGGRAIRMLHTPQFASIRRRFVCVEQTRCGIRTLEHTELEIPVVNVAECWAKLRYESPMIATSVKDELIRQLRVLDAAGFHVGRNVSIIGYGSIGRAVALSSRALGLNVRVFDEDLDRQWSAQRDGFDVIPALSTVLRLGGIIVGCTGLPVVGPDNYDDIAHNSILVSASSSDVEFQAWNLRASATCLGSSLAWKCGGAVEKHPCFSMFRCHREDHGFYLLNGGFPVNFTGGVDPIAADKIQLTRSLLYLGAWQASHSVAPGLQDLSDRHQRFLVQQFLPQLQQNAA